MPIDQEQLFEIICEQVASIDALTEQLGERVPTIGADSNWRIQPLIQKVNFDTDGKAVLDANPNRQGFIIVNETADLVYGAADTNDATVNYFTWKIESGAAEYYIPANGAYTGEVQFLALDNASYIIITEFSFQKGI